MFMVKKLAIFCKSFRDDFGRIEGLISSWRKYNPEIPFVLSVPRKDGDELPGSVRRAEGISLVFDEDYLGEDNESRFGWLEQQICKLSVGELEISENYYVIDSDSYFINRIDQEKIVGTNQVNVLATPVDATYTPKNVKLLDYIKNGEGLPGVNVEKADIKELKSRLQSAYDIHKSGDSLPARERRGYLTDIFGDPKDVKGNRLIFTPSPVFNVRILNELHNFLSSQNLNWRDAIYLSPWEYSWYGLFALRGFSEPVCAVHPTCVHFPTSESVRHAVSIGVDESDLARRFCSIAMAARHYDQLRFGKEDPVRK